MELSAFVRRNFKRVRAFVRQEAGGTSEWVVLTSHTTAIAIAFALLIQSGLFALSFDLQRNIIAHTSAASGTSANSGQNAGVTSGSGDGPIGTESGQGSLGAVGGI